MDLENKRIISTSWFTEMGNPIPIGIVIVEEDGERKAYIGTGFGTEERSDALKIIESGAKFSYQEARKILSELENVRLWFEDPLKIPKNS